MDGYVTIGTKLDTKDLEKELRHAITELKQYEREAQKLTEQKLKVDKDLEPYRKERAEIIKNNQNIGERNFKLGALKEQYNGLLKKEEELGDKLDKNAQNQEKATAKVKEFNSELSKSRKIDDLKASVESINQKMSSIIKKAVKWGLAIFGIRSAYSFVRNAISTLSQYDTQLATNVEYIRWALAMTLKPVIEYIVNLAYKLLGILRAIIKYLFNYDIFAKAGANAFKKAKENTSGVAKNIGKATKQAKELNKQLASFDEMNILGDNVKQAGDTSSGDTDGSSIPLPNEIPEIKIKDIKFNIDWEKIFNTILEKIDWFVDIAKEKVKDFFDNIGDKWIEKGEKLGGLLGDWSKRIGEFFKNVGDIVQLEIEGIGDIFKGLVKIIQGIFSGDIKKAVEGGFEIIKGIFEVGIASIGLLFNALSTVWKVVFDAWKNALSGLWNGIKDIFSKAVTSIGSIVGKIKVSVNWNKLKDGLSKAIDNIKKSLKNLGTKVGSVVVGAFKTVFNKLMSAVEKGLNTPISAINKMIKVINKLLPKKQEIGKLSTLKLPRLAKGGIVNLPSAGVPVGNAIAGERGAEGVIPLTDSQQMALLGEAIGKYITINANITNSMNGRVISRELQKIQNDDNFAYNR